MKNNNQSENAKLMKSAGFTQIKLSYSPDYYDSAWQNDENITVCIEKNERMTLPKLLKLVMDAASYAEREYLRKGLLRISDDLVMMPQGYTIPDISIDCPKIPTKYQRH